MSSVTAAPAASANASRRLPSPQAGSSTLSGPWPPASASAPRPPAGGYVVRNRRADHVAAEEAAQADAKIERGGVERDRDGGAVVGAADQSVLLGRDRPQVATPQMVM